MKRTQTGLCRLTFAAAGSLAIVISGCARAPKPQPLTPEAFISPQSGTISGAGGTASGSGGTVGAGESAAPAIAIPANGVSNKGDNAVGKPPAPTPVRVMRSNPSRRHPQIPARAAQRPPACPSLARRPAST